MALPIVEECLESIAQPSRVISPFKWFGGKGTLAKKILPYLPKGKVYVEPFCGAASIFWHLPKPFEVEVLNDLHSEIVNLFRVLQNKDTMEEFLHRVTFTLYSREEFRLALGTGTDAPPVDRAWAFFVRQNQGFAGKAKTEGRWGRVFTGDRGMAGNANTWRGRQKLIPDWHDRLSRVQIDSVDALKCIKYWDSPCTVFYIDPPYVHATRKGKEYLHECDDDFHAELVAILLGVKGKVMLSGYAHSVYDPLVHAGWRRVDIETACHAAARTRESGIQGKGAALAKVPRVETVWMNYDSEQPTLKELA